MNKLHLFGLTIITLVVAAFLNTPRFFIGVDPIIKIKIIALIALLVSIASVTIVRIFGKTNKIPEWIPGFLGMGLFFISGSMFFFNTDYFWHGVSLPMPFWHRVSFYTLPAIALESTIVTGFEYTMTTIKKLTYRERSWVTRLFFLYTFMTMAVNFMAIGKLIDVSLHIAIARIVIVSSIGIAIGVVIKKDYL